MMNHGDMSMSMWMVPHMLIMFIVLFGIIYFAVSLALKKYAHHDSISILKERFARGEITEEQFKRMQETLRS